MHKMCIRISTYWHQISIIFASFTSWESPTRHKTPAFLPAHMYYHIKVPDLKKLNIGF